jgi:predicted transcriptional regulator
MGQADIARLLRISPAAVSQLIHGKYPVNLHDEAPLPEKTVEALLEQLVDGERAALLRKLGGAA